MIRGTTYYTQHFQNYYGFVDFYCTKSKFHFHVFIIIVTLAGKQLWQNKKNKKNDSYILTPVAAIRLTAILASHLYSPHHAQPSHSVCKRLDRNQCDAKVVTDATMLEPQNKAQFDNKSLMPIFLKYTCSRVEEKN